MEKIGNIALYNADCMEVMKAFKDKEFDLAIVDPPYGINASKMHMGKRKGEKRLWSKKDWDSNIPNGKYFDELFRVSKNQIIWGGNYFTDHLPASRCWLSWNKVVPDGMSFADFELAWTSFDSVAREIRFKYSGAIQSGDYHKKIHPTQKPFELYKWLLENYANKGDKILDTHFGSLSIGLACYDLGFELTAIELDKEYYELAKKRLKIHQRQLQIF